MKGNKLKMMLLLPVMSILLTMAMPGCTGCHSKPGETADDSLPLLVARIQQCARLYTTEYRVRKVVTHDDQLTFEGNFLGHEFSIDIPAGDRKIAIPINATLKGYVDFKNFDSQHVRRDSNRLEIILPDPQVELTSTEIDHDKVIDHVALVRRRFSDEELSDYERQGRESIIRTIPQLGIEKRARTAAVQLLMPLLQQMGFDTDQVVISFRRDFTPDSMRITDLTKPGL